jgi:spore coat polysaccharide biosynthesis protein SpsF (cytidylyltransferase family)
MSKEILAGQVWRITPAAQSRILNEEKHQGNNITRVPTNFKVIGLTMDEMFEAESVDASIQTTLTAEDFERFLFHAPDEDELDEEDEDEILGAPGYYDN